MIPGPPTREILEDRIAFAERRFGRAQERLRAAQLEANDASTARDLATTALARWIEANPDPQPTIFEGETHV